MNTNPLRLSLKEKFAEIKTVGIMPKYFNRKQGKSCKQKYHPILPASFTSFSLILFIQGIENMKKLCIVDFKNYSKLLSKY